VKLLYLNELTRFSCIILGLCGKVWREAARMASVRRHQELPPCWTVSAGSKTGSFISCHILRFLEQGVGYL